MAATKIKTTMAVIPDKKDLSLLRSHMHEVAIVALSAVVVYLFLYINTINVYVRVELTKHAVEYKTAIEANTRALNDFVTQQRNENWEAIRQKIKEQP